MPKKKEADSKVSKAKKRSREKEAAPPVVETPVASPQPISPTAQAPPKSISKICGTCKHWQPRATMRGPCPVRRAQMNPTQTCGEWEGK